MAVHFVLMQRTEAFELRDETYVLLHSSFFYELRKDPPAGASDGGTRRTAGFFCRSQVGFTSLDPWEGPHFAGALRSST